MTSQENQDQLKSIVERYRVCFEVRPLKEAHDHEIQKVGYKLELIGTHSGTDHLGNPNRPEYRTIYADLHKLATAVIPKTPPKLHVDILPFDSSIHAAPTRHYRDDIELQLQILHETDDDVDRAAAEKACLDAITGGLIKLGARKGHW